MKIIKMRYSTEPKDRIYVKGYGDMICLLLKHGQKFK